MQIKTHRTLSEEDEKIEKVMLASAPRGAASKLATLPFPEKAEGKILGMTHHDGSRGH